ncbi:MAG: low molecular weight protein-tyrosine-phosphatase [Pseudomonadota bacterium]
MRVLFVCLGNICRSPMAEGIFRGIVQERGMSADVDSAGTSNWHIGEPPDDRGQARLREAGLDISDLKGRQVSVDDFDSFDFVIAMDNDNLAKLQRLAGPERAHKVSKFLDFAAGEEGRDVPDPYYGGPDGFDHVFDLITRAGHGLADHIQSKG